MPAYNVLSGIRVFDFQGCVVLILYLFENTIWIVKHPNDSKQIIDKKSLLTYSFRTGRGLIWGN